MQNLVEKSGFAAYIGLNSVLCTEGMAAIHLWLYSINFFLNPMHIL